MTGGRCIFASNTSSIPIAQIAAGRRSAPRTSSGCTTSPRSTRCRCSRSSAPTRPRPGSSRRRSRSARSRARRSSSSTTASASTRAASSAPYMNEAAHLLAEGVRDRGDRPRARRLGLAGRAASQLLDEVGIDVAAHVGPIMHAAFGDRMTPPGAMAKLVADDRKGRKNGRGFYLYGDAAREGRASAQVDPSGLRGARASSPEDEAARRGDPDALLAPARERGAALLRRGHPPEPARRRHRRDLRARLPALPRRAVPLRRHDRRGGGAPPRRRATRIASASDGRRRRRSSRWRRRGSASTRIEEARAKACSAEGHAFNDGRGRRGHRRRHPNRRPRLRRRLLHAGEPR